MRRPRQVGHARSGITCQIGSRTLASAPSSKIVRRKVAVRSVWRTPGRELGLDLGHGLLGDPQRVAQAGQLVGRLDQPWPRRSPRSASAAASRRTAAERSRCIAPVHSSTAMVARRRDEIGQRVRRRRRRPRRSRGTSGRAGGRRRARARRPSSARNGVNRWGNSSSASTTATGCSKLARPGIAQRPDGARWRRRRWCCRAAPGRRCPCSAMQRPEPGDALAPHPRRGRAVPGMLVGRRRRHQPGGHQSSSPRKRLDVRADDLDRRRRGRRPRPPRPATRRSSRRCSRCAGSPTTTSPGRRRCGRSARGRADRP